MVLSSKWPKTKIAPEEILAFLSLGIYSSDNCDLAQIENGNETEEDFEEDEDAEEPLEPENNGTPSNLSHVTEMRLVPKDSSVRILYLPMYICSPSVCMKSSLVMLLMLLNNFVQIAEVSEWGGTFEIYQILICIVYYLCKFKIQNTFAS